MRKFSLFSLLVVLAGLAACASPAPEGSSQSTSEPVAHEYRTGSLIATREKRPVTEEEKAAAQAIAEQIRSKGGGLARTGN